MSEEKPFGETLSNYLNLLDVQLNRGKREKASQPGYWAANFSMRKEVLKAILADFRDPTLDQRRKIFRTLRVFVSGADLSWVLSRHQQEAMMKVLEADDLARLNQLLNGYFRIVTPLRSEPAITAADGLVPTSQRAAALGEKMRLADKSAWEDNHAVLTEDAFLCPDEEGRHTAPTTLQVGWIRWWDLQASYQVAEKTHGNPPIRVTVNAVIVDPATRRMAVQVRSRQSSLAPCAYGILGGGMRDRPQGRDLALREALGREVSEELNQYPVLVPETVPMILTQELNSTRVMQINYLGAMSTHRNNYGRISEGEGRILWVDYDELVNTYLPRTERWVPMGWASVVAWLAVGAVNSGCRNDDKAFGKMTARDAFSRVMDRMEARCASHKPDEMWLDITPKL